MASSGCNFNWKDQVGKYVWIKDRVKIPLLTNSWAVSVLEVHPSGKKVKLRGEGTEEEIWYRILKNGEIKEHWYTINSYKFVRLLSKWEKLEFEVSDYIGDITDIDFDLKTIIVTTQVL